jgi:hypothetical protein
LFDRPVQPCFHAAVTTDNENMIRERKSEQLPTDSKVGEKVGGQTRLRKTSTVIARRC